MRLLLIAMFPTLTACAGGMIPGTIYSADGKVMPFEIEKAHRTGAVKARDPSTGEIFSGTYVGVKERVDVATSGTAISGKAVGSTFGSGSVQSNMVNATAYLQGDKGTMLNCEMKIEAGISPHGLGQCDDNKGGKYRLQF